MNNFLDFLQNRISQISEIEARAQHLLHNESNQDGYRAAMKEKATLLAHLSRDAEPVLENVPAERLPMIEHRLDMFSQSAQNSLNVGSVFYMSALLYPDDHKPGEPNTLETWLKDLSKN